MRTSLVLVVVLGSSTIAAADGERSPMVGLSVVGGDTNLAPSQNESLAGVGLDVAWWHGRFGLGGEASERWSLQGDGVRATVVGASARLRVFETLTPSWLDPRDNELGIELQAIVERTWWNQTEASVDPNAYGFGVALRLRGGDDWDGSTLLAESRFFLRVMTSKWAGLDSVARSTEVPTSPGRAFTVLLGIGASFGTGAPSYVRQFRMHPFRPTLLW